MKILTLIGGVWLMASVLNGSEGGCLISHGSEASFEAIFEKTKERLEGARELSISREEALWMLEQTREFDSGRYILVNKGINGYWTAYWALHVLEKESIANPLEEWIVRRAPLELAVQERFKIFKREVEKRMVSGMTLASVPCGLMDDLLLADRGNAQGVKLLGIDLDEESLALARENARMRGVEADCDFLKRDAWDLGLEGECDLITSSGLNVYEPDNERVKDLYRNFYRALRPGGILVISFFTPPPALDKNSPWRDYDAEDLRKQRGLFVDVWQVNWQVFRTEAQMREHLESAGFRVLEVIYDRQAMFPTVVAQRD